MASVTSLNNHLIEELTDLLDAEEQLTQALPNLARSATSKVLRGAFQKHLKETRGHITRLKQALRELGEKPQGKTCKGMEGLLEEGEAVMNKTPEGALRDAVMITGPQKVEHYEMASYGTARTYAQVLGETNIARLLAQTLKEEKAADRTLTQIAEKSVNEEAAEEWQSSEEDGLLSRSAEWAGSAATSASQNLASGVRRVASAVGVVDDRRSRGSAPRRGARKQRTSRSGGRTAGKKR